MIFAIYSLCFAHVLGRRFQGAGNADAAQGGWKTKGDWCLNTCFSDAERLYLSEHNSDLQGGLNALRQPGCVQARKVIVGGYFRTGSTLLFNQARLWMALAFPNETAAGYNPSAQQWDASPRLVAKEHSIDRAKAQSADVLLMSRRHVAASVAARLIRIDGIFNKSEAHIAKAIARECTLLMDQQAAAYKVWEQSGKQVAYDVLLEDFDNDPLQEIAGIARALGICPKAQANVPLQKFIMFMADKLVTDPSQSGTITQMHPPTTEDNKPYRPLIQRLLEQAPSCNRWALGAAAHTANDRYHA